MARLRTPAALRGLRLATNHHPPCRPQRKDASRLALDGDATIAAIRAAELAQPRGSPADNPRDHVWPGHMPWQGKAPKSIEAGVLYIVTLLWAVKGQKQVRRPLPSPPSAPPPPPPSL
jgi:hypothetical protein